MEFYHTPIMLNEILEGLKINPSGIYLDCTLGGAGHSEQILKRLNSKGLLIGIDKDEEALSYSAERLKEFNNKLLVKSDFKLVKTVLEEHGIQALDGVLIDLGVSSHQIDSAERGFSFNHDGKLDMRMDKSQKLSAYEVVNFYSEKELLNILWRYGEENYARSIVRKIVEARKQKPIQTTFELKNIIESAVPKKYLFSGASKKTFQAIRIEVNDELNGLEEVLKYLITKLKPGGRMAVLSFHSLEDRIVKSVFKLEATDCICSPDMPICTCGHKKSVKLINKKPILASPLEQNKNPRATSAKLRIVEKV